MRFGTRSKDRRWPYHRLQYGLEIHMGGRPPSESGAQKSEVRVNVHDKRASQPASKQVVHAVVGEQCAVAEEAEQQSGGAGRNTGPFPAELTQGPLQR